MIVRASSLGNIMADGASSSITAKQSETLQTLLSKIELTEKQAQTRDELIAKRDAPPQLSKGAKTYIEKKALEDKYGIVNEIESRYLDKGIICEDEAIHLASSALGWNLIFKNEDRFINEWVTGEPDIVTDDFIADIKCSWSFDTFPFFEEKVTNKMYYWQCQAYMMLTGKPTSYLVYCLVNTPEHLFTQELDRKKWKAREVSDCIDLPLETKDAIYEELFNKHNFDRIDFKKRVKAYEIKADEKAFKKIKEKCGLATVYYNKIKEEL